MLCKRAARYIAPCMGWSCNKLPGCTFWDVGRVSSIQHKDTAKPCHYQKRNLLPGQLAYSLLLTSTRPDKATRLLTTGQGCPVPAVLQNVPELWQRYASGRRESASNFCLVCSYCLHLAEQPQAIAESTPCIGGCALLQLGYSTMQCYTTHSGGHPCKLQHSTCLNNPYPCLRSPRFNRASEVITT